MRIIQEQLFVDVGAPVADEQTRTCSGPCGLLQRIESFPRCGGAGAGRLRLCRTCHKEHERVVRAPETYSKLVVAHGETCRICGTPPPNRNYRLDVDVEHSTLRVRGLLCGTHNKGLGHFGDDPVLLLRAHQYLMGELLA